MRGRVRGMLTVGSRPAGTPGRRLRRAGVLAVSAVALAALAACGNPAGTDGDLVDDWAAVSEPKPFVPAAETCHQAFKETGYLREYQPVPCTGKHEAETLARGLKELRMGDILELYLDDRLERKILNDAAVKLSPAKE